MKKLLPLIIIFALVFSFASCSSDNSDIKGVSVTDSGNVSVTFKIPNGKSAEDILGSKIGDENTFYVSGASNKDFYVYWYNVESGGILSRNGDVYCYGPKAVVSYTTGVAAPPNWVMIYSIPSADEIFNAEDTELLKDKYGIDLHFD